MLDFFSETKKNYIAFHVKGNWSFSAFTRLYLKLARHYSQYGKLYVYEELSDFNFLAFLSTLIGTYHDFKYRKAFHIKKIAIVSDSPWAGREVFLWKKIRSFYPVAPESARCFSTNEKKEAREWLKT